MSKAPEWKQAHIAGPNTTVRKETREQPKLLLHFLTCRAALQQPRLRPVEVDVESKLVLTSSVSWRKNTDARQGESNPGSHTSRIDDPGLTFALLSSTWLEAVSAKRVKDGTSLRQKSVGRGRELYCSVPSSASTHMTGGLCVTPMQYRCSDFPRLKQSGKWSMESEELSNSKTYTETVALAPISALLQHACMCLRTFSTPMLSLLFLSCLHCERSTDRRSAYQVVGLGLSSDDLCMCDSPFSCTVEA
ncbi:hypothetical protein BCV70DRAFT_44529 [Testicularia cyperi]|uniref:Uncharacterized protein n=1 Tax=Testicularia cyperi TaxID=1882483 RepID=A0A317XGF6_9BASI|nr:hypothetical protein BCV70DRAFT_68750 [Testicularia cyperi]PWY97714.1 hypothetical protein BCV70DRAFT_44529 [Testicularia cyperi]